MDKNQLAAVAASSFGGFPSDIPGLYNVPGYPELTTDQVISEYVRLSQNVSPDQRLGHDRRGVQSISEMFGL